ncbi:hypothetical protein [Acinetobacter lactucae]|uniref:hypothetical protein n=1 Tax=Acinetobacter lactucae TaxID=1785128 RepID=UPI000A41B525|nr:hypothetical protein [Acinetobacter lactucae]
MELIKLLVKAKLTSKVTANEGFKLSLFRYPEDASSTEAKDSKPATPNKKRKTN